MDGNGNKKKAKEIADKYRFSEFRKLSEREKDWTYEELYRLYLEAEIEIDLLETENARLNKQLEENKIKKPSYNNYDSNWKGIEKVIYILRKNQKVMLSKEIMQELLNVQPDLIQKWDKPYPATIKYITRGVNFGRIIQYNKIGSGGFTYALPEWFDEDGNLISKFSYH